ncbi:MAG: DUF1819 family protein [Nostoc sp. TH1S01]|nr:DUF1819 family protein [Nostoc sp. TH1S01]
MTQIREMIYTSKIIKAGALLTDTKTFFANWNVTLSVSENLDKFRQENLFGKASRSRVEDILAIFRQRYLKEESVTKALITLVNCKFPAEGLNSILYFHSTQSDSLLHDVVTDLLLSLHGLGRHDINVSDVKNWINKQIAQGKTQTSWSDRTITGCAREILSTLRDFGILKGASKKYLTPIYLPVQAFAYIALYLKQRQPSGEKLINSTEWQLFFLSTKAVESFFVEAHQHRLLEYYAAGSIIRIEFPTNSLEEYANVIAS